MRLNRLNVAMHWTEVQEPLTLVTSHFAARMWPWILEEFSNFIHLLRNSPFSSFLPPASISWQVLLKFTRRELTQGSTPWSSWDTFLAIAWCSCFALQLLVPGAEQRGTSAVTRHTQEAEVCPFFLTARNCPIIFCALLVLCCLSGCCVFGAWNASHASEIKVFHAGKTLFTGDLHRPSSSC